MPKYTPKAKYPDVLLRPTRLAEVDRVHPSVFLDAQGLRIIRGYQVSGRGRFEFIGAADGPLVRLVGPGASLLGPVEFMPQVIAALQAAIAAPVAAAGAHDDEIRAMGYEPAP